MSQKNKKILLVVLTLAFFLPGFIIMAKPSFMSIAQLDILPASFYENLTKMEAVPFWFSYLIVVYLLQKMSRAFIGMAESITLSPEISFFENTKRAIKVFLISFLLGFWVHIAIVFAFASLSYFS